VLLAATKGIITPGNIVSGLGARKLVGEGFIWRQPQRKPQQYEDGRRETNPAMVVAGEDRHLVQLVRLG